MQELELKMQGGFFAMGGVIAGFFDIIILTYNNSYIIYAQIATGLAADYTDSVKIFCQCICIQCICNSPYTHATFDHSVLLINPLVPELIIRLHPSFPEFLIKLCKPTKLVVKCTCVLDLLE